MEFPDLSSETGVQFLDDYLSTRSYVSGYEASKNDQLVWAALKGKEPGPAAVNARRWYRHVAFFSGKNLPESDEKIRITVSNSVSDPKVEVQTQLLCLNLLLFGPKSLSVRDNKVLVLHNPCSLSYF